LIKLDSFAKDEDMAAFARAIKIADNPQSPYEHIVTSINEWQVPIETISKPRKASDRSPDEGREGYTYRLLRWPAFVLSSRRASPLIRLRSWYSHG